MYHKKKSGFVIRQICHITLLIRNEKENIGWDKFNQSIEKANMKRFSDCILVICNQLLELEIPNKIKISIDANSKYVSALIDFMFIGGVHGKNDSTEAVLQRANKKFFITIDELSKGYRYINKSKLLVPIAYIHRCIKWILGKKFSLKQKKKILIEGHYIQKEIDELNQWLDI